MKQIVMFDTSYGSQNLGDFIIAEAIKTEMRYLIDKSFVVRYPTHTPISTWIQAIAPVLSTRTCKNADYKFICGTNIVKYSLLRPARDWSVNLLNAHLYKGSILIGAGREINAKRVDTYTKRIYRAVLSSAYVHSARDAQTADLLDSLGYDAVCTGCPTTWSLTNELIDSTYSMREPDTALFTLTDYAVNEEFDRQLIDTLLNKYKEVLFWPQGSRDYAYIQSLGYMDKITILPANMDAYEKVMNCRFDYIGTRLHGGIYALSHSHRCLILSVDNRASDMADTVGLPAIPREDLQEIKKFIETWPRPRIRIPHAEINKWKAQFLP